LREEVTTMNTRTTRVVRVLHAVVGAGILVCLSGCGLDGKYTQAPPPISTGAGTGTGTGAAATGR
jgi:hypothetical protein